MLEDFAKMLANQCKVQAEILREMHDEIQEMKVCLVDSVMRLKKTVKHMVELMKAVRSSEEKASDGNLQQPSQRCVSVMQSVNSTLGVDKLQQFKGNCQTSHVGNPRKIRASTFRHGLGFTEHQHVHCGGDGAKGTYSFDLGKVMFT
ncbi:hypothetical protein Bca101_023676 [Brassica carinata]